MREIDPYEYLANAIILQAVSDYRRLWHLDVTDVDKKRIIDFFRSGNFAVYTNLDADWLIEILEKEANAKRSKRVWNKIYRRRMGKGFVGRKDRRRQTEKTKKGNSKAKTLSERGVVLAKET